MAIGTVNVPGKSYSPATQSSDGLMSATDKTKLDGISRGSIASGNTGYATGGDVYTALSGKASTTDLADKLDKSGGTMSGSIAMGSNRITGLAAGVNDNDAVTKKQMEDAIAEGGGGGTTIVQIPTVTVGEYTYDGTEQGPTIGSYSSDQIVVTNAKKTDAGTYTLTLALKNTQRMVWSDLTTADKTFVYTIDKRQITPPTVSGAYTYNGSSKSASISYASGTSAYITQGGNASGTNAGSYTVTFDLNDSINTEWSDGTTAQKSGSWSIAKAAPTFSLSTNAVTLNASGRSATATLTYAGDGEVSVSTSDDTVATASLSGGTVTIASVDDTTGTATITVSATEGTNYLAASGTISVTAQFTTIYGASWDGTSTTAWTRTDAAAGFSDPVPAVGNGNGSSPFDNCMPWSGMERVTDSEAGTLVKIPKFYYKWTRSGAVMKLQIADGPVDGFLVSPAHADRGDGSGERDLVYVGAYHCSTNDYKSTTGVMPKASITRSTARSSIHNLGSKIWQCDYAMRWTIQMLYLVEYANWNSQAKIGYGCSNNGSIENAGACDAMPYHTGTNASSRTTYGHTRYRWIEDLWGNVYDWCDGIYFSGSNVYCIKNPSSFSDSSGGTLVGTRPTSSNYISAYTNPTASGFEWALYPSAVSGSESTYVCDYCSYNSSGVVLRVGGYYNQSQNLGLFFLVGNSSASNSNGDTGSRLQKLP